jgi:putative endonuclease
MAEIRRIKPRPDGQRWERVAESFLRKRGLHTLKRNYHCRWGELDLIMQEGEQLVFVEVRYRQHSTYGGAAESIGRQKQQRIATTAAYFLARHPRHALRVCRFDVLSIDSASGQTDIQWIRNAFEPTHG